MVSSSFASFRPPLEVNGLRFFPTPPFPSSIAAFGPLQKRTHCPIDSFCQFNEMQIERATLALDGRSEELRRSLLAPPSART